MKKMIAALVLAAAAASPAMAETEAGLNSGYSTFNSQAYGAYASTAPAQARSLKRTRTHVEMAPDINGQPNTSDLIDR